MTGITTKPKAFYGSVGVNPATAKMRLSQLADEIISVLTFRPSSRVGLPLRSMLTSQMVPPTISNGRSLRTLEILDSKAQCGSELYLEIKKYAKRLWRPKMRNVYELHSSDFNNIGPDRAVDFFRRLLWAESSRVGVDRNLIEVPARINVGDGGLDAVIYESVSPSSEELIPLGISGFQIKSSDLSPAECRNELHEEDDLRKPLKSAIINLLNQGGTYILVLYEDIVKERMFTNRKSAIEDELRKCRFPDAKVRLYTISQLIGFARRFPSLVAWLKGSPHFLGYENWQNQPGMKDPSEIINDDKRNKFIEEIRENLSSISTDDKTVVKRIKGLPGLGKTRLVLEALKPDNLKNRVLFFNDGRNLSNNIDFIHYLLNETDIHAIIVVDECQLREHKYLKNRYPQQVQTLSYYNLK